MNGKKKKYWQKKISKDKKNEENIYIHEYIL